MIKDCICVLYKMINNCTCVLLSEENNRLGDIKLSILNDEGEEIANTEANEKFVYQKKMMNTLLLDLL